MSVLGGWEQRHCLVSCRVSADSFPVFKMLFCYKKHYQRFHQMQTSFIKVRQKKTYMQCQEKSIGHQLLQTFPTKKEMFQYLWVIDYGIDQGLEHEPAAHSCGQEQSSQTWTPKPKVLHTRKTLPCTNPYTCKCCCTDNFKYHACEMHKLIKYILNRSIKYLSIKEAKHHLLRAL